MPARIPLEERLEKPGLKSLEYLTRVLFRSEAESPSTKTLIDRFVKEAGKHAIEELATRATSSRDKAKFFSILKAAGYPFSDVAEGAKRGGFSHKEISKGAKRGGFSHKEVDEIMRKMSGHREIAAKLKSLGANFTAEVLYEGGHGLNSIADGLYYAGHGCKEIAEALARLGYGPGSISGWLTRSRYKHVAKALKYAGFSKKDIRSALEQQA